RSFEEFQSEDKTKKTERNETIDQAVLEIIKEVRTSGDSALFKYAEKFDDVSLNELLVSMAEFEEANQLVSKEFVDAIEVAMENITAFHEAQMEKSWFLNKADGVMLGQQ